MKRFLKIFALAYAASVILTVIVFLAYARGLWHGQVAGCDQFMRHLGKQAACFYNTDGQLSYVESGPKYYPLNQLRLNQCTVGTVESL